MSTKNTTSGSNSNSTSFNFNNDALGQYTANINNLMPWLRSNISNPFGSPMFQQESAIGQDQANQVGSRLKSNVLSNANALGYSTNSGLFNQLVQNAGYQTANLGGQAFRGAIGNAINRQNLSAGILSSFQPLLQGTNSTGTFNQTSQQSGLGTWLPQLASTAIGAGIGAFTGGAAAGAGPQSVFSGNMGEGLGLGQSGPSGPPSFGGMIGGLPGYGYGSGSGGGPPVNLFGTGGPPSYGGGF